LLPCHPKKTEGTAIVTACIILILIFIGEPLDGAEGGVEETQECKILQF